MVGGGAVMSISFFRDTQPELSQHRAGGMSPAMVWVYRVANVIMNSLNAMWFYKMAKGALKVLAVSSRGKGPHKREVTDYEERNRG